MTTCGLATPRLVNTALDDAKKRVEIWCQKSFRILQFYEGTTAAEMFRLKQRRRFSFRFLRLFDPGSFTTASSSENICPVLKHVQHPVTCKPPVSYDTGVGPSHPGVQHLFNLLKSSNCSIIHPFYSQSPRR